MADTPRFLDEPPDDTDMTQADFDRALAQAELQTVRGYLRRMGRGESPHPDIDAVEAILQLAYRVGPVTIGVRSGHGLTYYAQWGNAEVEAGDWTGVRAAILAAEEGT